ncbi:hypothetical protein JOD45_001203 [Scopulibacillus daqui]|uniref:Uncharacterized protein n=1 Tax=Scopulibacillus daqui TaxID=1469162 RepID=A0ABS2PY72_9BACL|nr:hypothetical protein [Scopulibacillus daqui]
MYRYNMLNWLKSNPYSLEKGENEMSGNELELSLNKNKEIIIKR